MKTYFEKMTDSIAGIIYLITHLARLFRSIKIQARLILLFLILSLIPLLITGFYSYRESSNAIKTKISTYSVQVMDQIGANILREIDRLENDSVEIAFMDRVQKTLRNYHKMSEWEVNDVQWFLREALTKKFTFLHDVSDVLLFTTDGYKIIAFGDKNYSFNLKMEYLGSLLKKAIEREGVPIWDAIDKDDEKHAVPFVVGNDQFGILMSRAVKSLEEGDVIGSLLIRTNERFFANVYRNIDIGTGADIFVIDSKGRVVSSRNPEIAVAKEYKDASLIGSVLENKNEERCVFDRVMNDKRYLVAFSYIEKADWYVVSTIPYSYIESESRKTGVKIAFLGLVFFLMAIILSYVFARSISTPLKKLVRAMNEAKKGNLSISITDENKDEIGEVTRNFNNMLEEIKNLLHDVQNKEKQKRNAELKALQAQINPHFLSNTLNTVKWMASIQKAENIENLITSLIQLLHVSMGKGEDMITLREELEYIKSYITIQEYKYYDKFKVNYEIEQEILDCKIPKFLLQPVIENSIIHGIEPMDGQGLIVVKAFSYNGDVKLTVKDDGVGIPPDTLKMIRTQENTGVKSRFSGIGIGNVNERIKLLFGEKYGLHIESIPGLFTTVEITLPSLK